MTMFNQEVLEFGQRSQNMLGQLGLVMPSRPNQELSFPNDLGDIGDEELGIHLSYWASMCSYALQKVAVLEGALILAKEKADQEYDLRLYSKTKAGMKITEARSLVNSTKSVRDLKTAVSVIEADLKVLKSVQIGYDLKNSAISREITRRSHERNTRNG